ncbi:ATP-binding cassette, subfamily B [Marinilactibacillus piezotolerans]|uniref:ATP-binding cassette, subfamily B n=1 Tax=Marinilactibacillus piezotolerans TaxID=258723 RepID=A0A1I4ABG9_9LACT|nr:ABC transporter ATP-binding protein [Marinilactibacillus piezotolerans]SFK53099.1 ATP-binding cassette, subfamily B [Marinilactibacillus piezotolerans]
MIRLLKYAKKNQIYAYIGAISKLMEAVFELFLPIFLARLIDRGINQGDTRYVLQMGGMMLVLSTVGFAFAMICQYFSSIASQGYGTELRNIMTKKINTFSHKELDEFGTATLITRVTNDVNQMQLALAMLIRLVIRAPFLSIGSIIMALYISPRLSLIFAVLLPVFTVMLGFIMWITIPLYKKVQVRLDAMAQTVSENMSGVRVIRAFARKGHELNRSKENSEQLSRANIIVNNLSALMTPSTTLVMNIGIMIILYIGAVQTNNGDLFQGEVLALINYMNQMLLALIVVANLVVIFTKSQASASRINEVLDTTVAINNQSDSKQIEVSAGFQAKSAIRFNHVSFDYGKKGVKALDTINFSVPVGSVTGITGPTGSGKSSLVQLIPRFYDVTEGEVLVFNQQVTKYGLKTLRNLIGYVPQKNVLFRGTIAENLRWGKESATEEELYAALRIAQMDSFVRELPSGIHSAVSENGKNFSGGQQQRLTIARALVSKPKIIILDDSLSALDYETDYKLRRALKEIKNASIIILSQRISSIQTADQILVMNNGAIESSGTHGSLLQQSETYQKIYQSQTDPESIILKEEKE